MPIARTGSCRPPFPFATGRSSSRPLKTCRACIPAPTCRYFDLSVEDLSGVYPGPQVPFLDCVGRTLVRCLSRAPRAELRFVLGAITPTLLVLARRLCEFAGDTDFIRLRGLLGCHRVHLRGPVRAGQVRPEIRRQPNLLLRRFALACSLDFPPRVRRSTLSKPRTVTRGSALSIFSASLPPLLACGLVTGEIPGTLCAPRPRPLPVAPGELLGVVAGGTKRLSSGREWSTVS